MKPYNDLVKRILSEGEVRADRTGVGTLAVPFGDLTVDLRDRFPLVQCKKTLYEKAFIEMLWFLRGDDTIKWLEEHGAGALWKPWADQNGYLGPIYGVQWRAWTKYEWYDGEASPGGIDQIRLAIRKMIENPTDRAIIVNAWNVSELEEMALRPCHRDFHCYVSNDKHLDLTVSQRSWDVALGAPFNIAQYALLTHLLARAAGLRPRRLRFNYGDAHLYLNHVDAMMEVVERPEVQDECRLVIDTNQTDIDGYKPSDFRVDGYFSHPFVKLPVAV